MHVFEITTLGGNRYTVQTESMNYGSPSTFYGPTGAVIAEGTVKDYQLHIEMVNGTTLVRGGGEPYSTLLNVLAFELGETIAPLPIPTFDPATKELIMGLKKGDVIQVSGNPYAFLDGCKVFAGRDKPRELQTFEITLTDDYKSVRDFDGKRHNYFDSIDISGQFKFSGYRHTFHLGALVENFDHWQRNYGYFIFDKVLNRA